MKAQSCAQAQVQESVGMGNFKFKRSPAGRDAMLGAERSGGLSFILEPLGGSCDNGPDPFCSSAIGTDNPEEMQDQVVTQGTPQSSCGAQAPAERMKARAQIKEELRKNRHSVTDWTRGWKEAFSISWVNGGATDGGWSAEEKLVWGEGRGV